MIAHDKSIFAEQQTSEMGHIALTIWDAIHATKGNQRSSYGRFSGRVPGTSKLYDGLPDEIAEVNLINASLEEQVWQIYFDGASRINLEGNIIAGVG